MLVNELKLLYMHPSKTGGTSIEQAFINFIYKRDISYRKLSYSDRQRIFCYCDDKNMSQHFTWSMLKSKFSYLTEYYHVVSVRHPYSRFISEFRYQLNGGGYPHMLVNSESHKNKDINMAIATGALFECAWPYHTLEMSEYYTPKAYVIHQEHMERDWIGLQNTIYFNLPPLPKLNVSTGDMYELNQESKDIIYNKYKQDFELFGYNR